MFTGNQLLVNLTNNYPCIHTAPSQGPLPKTVLITYQEINLIKLFFLNKNIDIDKVTLTPSLFHRSVRHSI